MSVRVAFMGDLVVPKLPTKVSLEMEPGTYDLAVCNLEGACRSGRPIHKLANLYSDTQPLMDMCQYLGIKYVNLANNHVMDFGNDGLKELTHVLTSISVVPFGAGSDNVAARSPAFYEDSLLRIAFLGFSWKPIESIGASSTRTGVALIPELSDLCGLIRQARSVSTHVVVSFHWGYEYERYPLPLHRRIAHAAIDAGASVIIGHHPHVYQGIEIHEGGFIFYSLGNFYMPIPMKPEADFGIVPVLEFVLGSVKPVTTLYSIYERKTDTLRLTERYTLVPDIKFLSRPLTLGEEEYLRFFRVHRARRRGLPVFTGSQLDALRYIWLDARSCLVRTAVKLGVWR